MENKPDSVVFNKETQQYDAFLKDYGVSVGGPKIESVDLTPFKKSTLTKASHHFTKRANEIFQQMEYLRNEYSDNKTIWESDMSFEPYCGCEIWVYSRENGTTFSSILSPSEWGNKHQTLGNFTLGSDFIWKRIPDKK